MWTRSKEALLSLIFPALCESCRVPISSGRPGVCESCEASVRRMPAPFCSSCGRTSPAITCPDCLREDFHHDRAHVTAFYEGKLKEWLHALKFDGRKPLSKILERLLWSHIERHVRDGRFDSVLAVPIDPNTLKERGFNQARLLSKAVAARLGVSEVSAALGRVRSAVPQHLLDRKSREANVRDRFFVKNPSLIRGRSLLLVDDVLTTGRTVSECARVLKAAGAARVEVIAVAGSPKS